MLFLVPLFVSSSVPAFIPSFRSHPSRDNGVAAAPIERATGPPPPNHPAAPSSHPNQPPARLIPALMPNRVESHAPVPWGVAFNVPSEWEWDGLGGITMGLLGRYTAITLLLGPVICLFAPIWFLFAARFAMLPLPRWIPQTVAPPPSTPWILPNSIFQAGNYT